MKGKSLLSCKTKVLSELEVVEPAFTESPMYESSEESTEPSTDEFLPLGNHAYALELRQAGFLGNFFPRHSSTTHYIELHPQRLKTGIQATFILLYFNHL